jgi:MoxR-like ATPase
MLKLKRRLPGIEEERRRSSTAWRTAETPSRPPVVDPELHPRGAQVVDEIYVDDKIKDYIVELVFATREPRRLQARPGPLIELRRLAARHLYLTSPPRPTPSSRAAATSPRRTSSPSHGRAAPPRHPVTYEAEAEDVTPISVVRRDPRWSVPVP